MEEAVYNPVVGSSWKIKDGKFIVHFLCADGWVSRYQPFLSEEDLEELKKKQAGSDAVRFGKYVK